MQRPDIHPGAPEPGPSFDCCTDTATDFDCDGMPIYCSCNPIPDYDGHHIAIYIAGKVKSNVRELEGSLVRLVAISSMKGVPISKALAQESMKNILDAERPAGLTMDHIARTVASHYKMTIEDIKAKNNSRGIAVPRQVAMYLCKRLTRHSFPEIGKEFGGKHHTTVMHSVDKIDTLFKNDRNFHREVKDLIDNLCS